ncbi:Gfo/Idh/MocA family protein [Paenibacillus cymbidii]|uniref:Gfo/Idh/MocA family protein n=1 Tax=Paenibacillus cymbidii TaxID=1639034 RepID=UPI001436BB36|nr:Gfo/Idh/MocA family oxidoreductase [Paenibacillus cymbidii]
MNNVYRLGCIGTGNISNAAHIPAYVSHRRIMKVTAIFDTNPDHANRTKQHYIQLMQEANSPVDWEIVICDTIDDLWSHVDIVDICTSLRFHSHYAALALQHNVHAMSEKPMARTWWEAQHVANAARTSAALFQLNDDNLFIPRYQAMRNVVESGAIGDVQHVWIARGTYSSKRAAWFFDPIEGGGGAILDYGSHAVASTWFMIGFDKEPQEVRSLGVRVKNRTRLIEGRLQTIHVDDDAHFKIRYRNPESGDWINVVIEATWSWPDLAENGSDVKGYIEVQGSKGSVTSVFDENDKEYLKITDRFFGERLIPIKSYMSEDLSFEDEMVHFCRTIEQGAESLLNAERGATIIKMINGAQLSELNRRQSVSLDEVEAFTRQFDRDGRSVLEVADRIAIAFNEPHRVGC